MSDSKPITNNTEKKKSKHKKDELVIKLSELNELKFGDEKLSGADMASYADALAGAKVALKAIEKTVKHAEAIIKAATMRQYCEHFSQTGRAPELRRMVGGIGSFQAVQHNRAKVTKDKANLLRRQGVDLYAYKDADSYTIRMGAASSEATKKIIHALREVLGDDYDDIVSEYINVGSAFFGKLDNIVKESLGPDERLDDKMLSVLRTLNPTIQLSKFESDMTEPAGFDLAYEFSQISSTAKGR